MRGISVHLQGDNLDAQYVKLRTARDLLLPHLKCGEIFV